MLEISVLCESRTSDVPGSRVRGRLRFLLPRASSAMATAQSLQQIGHRGAGGPAVLWRSGITASLATSLASIVWYVRVEME